MQKNLQNTYISKTSKQAIMEKRIISILAVLLAFAAGTQAQQTNDGNKVKRITFDREQVKIEYTDGTREDVEDAVTISREEIANGIRTVKTAGKQSARRWYTVDGRPLQGEPRQKGVYIVRDRNNVKKTVRK